MVLQELLVRPVRPGFPCSWGRGGAYTAEQGEHVALPEPRDGVHDVSQNVPDDVEEGHVDQGGDVVDARLLVRGIHLLSSVTGVASSVRYVGSVRAERRGSTNLRVPETGFVTVRVVVWQPPPELTPFPPVDLWGRLGLVGAPVTDLLSVL